jgi:hypothetical protein
LVVAALTVIAFRLAGQSPRVFPLKSAEGLQLKNVRTEAVSYQGRSAVRVVQLPGATGEDTLAVLAGSDFKDGTIELELAGAPGPGAVEAARGFIGVAFRAPSGAAKFECFYLRPTNGRAEDQLRRNHSTQYVSFPDYPWMRLRKESPGLYESYADLQPGVWTKVKIVVAGLKARLYVDGAEQPCLLVNDLKLGETRGAVGLWVGPGTEGYFRELRITP